MPTGDPPDFSKIVPGPVVWREDGVLIPLLTNDELVKAIDKTCDYLRNHGPRSDYYPYFERHLSALLKIQETRASAGASDQRTTVKP